MVAAFANRIFRRLFAAQIVALLGTGMLTVALSLLAYDLAGDSAGQVLGIAFAIKMVAYVGVSPLAGVMLANLPRKWVLIGSDVFRCGLAVLLPFVDAVWQIYLLIFLLQAASASFTPVFQAMIADLLRDEAEYTSSLSLSRAAYDLESLLSPVIAALFASVWYIFAETFEDLIDPDEAEPVIASGETSADTATQAGETPDPKSD